MKTVVLGSDSPSGRGSQRSRVWSRVGGSVYVSCGMYFGYDGDRDGDGVSESSMMLIEVQKRGGAGNVGHAHV